jgi:hypothetical protein
MYSSKRRKMFKSAYFIFLLIIGGFSMLAAKSHSSGTIPDGMGTSADPYKIATMANLRWVSATSACWSKGNFFVMTADIDASETSTSPMSPIGNSSDYFYGVFHGAGHRIKNLTMYYKTTSEIGLFGVLGDNSTGNNSIIDSLGVTNSKITGKSGVGAIVGTSYSRWGINYCYAIDDTVNGDSCDVGLIAGRTRLSSSYGNGTIIGCFATGKVESVQWAVGGIVGCQHGLVANSYARATVQGQYNCGGIAGRNQIKGGPDSICYSASIVKAKDDTAVGGFVGTLEYAGDLESCFWDTLLCNPGTYGTNGNTYGNGKTTTQMKTMNTYTDSGWDFTNIWTIASNANDGYPCFRWMAKPTVETEKIVAGVMDSTGLLDTVVCYGNLKSLSLSAPTEYGICWNTTGTPTKSDNVVNLGEATSTGRFSAKITGLTASEYTICYFRAYALNSVDTVYGEQYSFMRGIVSYHWQPSESKYSLKSAGSYDSSSLDGKIKYNKLDSGAMWLDTASNGKRYSVYLDSSITGGGIQASTSSKYTNTMAYMNHTFYIFAKNTVPKFTVKMLRDTTKSYWVDISYSNDSIYMASFGKNKRSTFADLSTGKKAGSWVPFYVHINNITSEPDSVRVSFGYGNQELAYIVAGDSAIDTSNTPYVKCSVKSTDTTSTAAQMSDIHLFSTNDANGVDNLWPLFFSSQYLTTGPIMSVPVLIHNIIYDPPGSESYSTCVFDTSMTTTLDFTWSANASASLEIGAKGDLEVEGGFLGIVESGFTISEVNTVKGEAHYKYEHNVGYDVSLSKSTSTSSMVDAVDSAYIGPTLGDVVVYQVLKYRTLLMKRPIMSKFRTASDTIKDYVFATAGGMPVPDSCSAVYYMPIKTLIGNLHKDTSGLGLLQSEYPYDLQTGKVRVSLFDSTWNSAKTAKNPPRLQKYENIKEIGGNIIYSNSVSRDSVARADSTHSWGASVTHDEALWTIAGGYELNISAGCDFALKNSVSNSHGSTLSYTLQDEDSWDKFRITPYTDNRFKTICFVVDTANSYSSFPHEANTQPAVTWNVSSIAKTNGYVGQETDVKVTVKNTSPKSVLPSLPGAFPFSIAAVNFPGSFSVTPEDAEIAIGDSVVFTVAFTGASADSFTQRLKVICWKPDLSKSMCDTVYFPMILKAADTGLYVSCAQDTFTFNSNSSPTHAFNVSLTNTGAHSSTIIFGTDSVTTGTTVGYGTITNPVAAKDSASLAITLTGNGSHDIYTLYYWAQIEGNSATISHHKLILKDSSSTKVVKRTLQKIQELGMVSIGKGKLELLVPDNESPTLKMFSINGKMIMTEHVSAGRTTIDINAMHLTNGLYIMRMQGKTKVCQQKVIISSKKKG